MVSIEENIHYLNDYLYFKVIEGSQGSPFKSAFLHFLGLSSESIFSFDFSVLSLYQKCAISGFGILKETVSNQDISRLLGQAAKIDSTPQPWVSDVFGVLAIKWLVEQRNDTQILREFDVWTSGFLAQQISGEHFTIFEKDIASYIRAGELADYISASIPLFLYFQKKLNIGELKLRSLINNFMNEFQSQSQSQLKFSTLSLSIIIYVFRKINQNITIAPPKIWGLHDLLAFLEHIHVGLRRWTWEESPRTKNSEPVQWQVENEYHVQNLLYILLAPIFNDIADEIYLKPIGHKTPRLDLYLPSLHTIIEVKFRKDKKKSFQSFIGEIGEDASLYRADPQYEDAKIICFLWDCTRSTQDHIKFKEGVLSIHGIDGCVVLSSPSTINNK